MNRRGRSFTAVLAAAVGLAACGGGSDGGGGNGGGSGGNTEPDPPGGGTSEVMVDGTVTFDFVPSRGGALMFDETDEDRPARAVTVEARADGDVLASDVTDEAGGFAFELPANRSVTLRVRAEMERSTAPVWDVRVVDNTDGDSLYVLEGTPFDTGEADSTRNLHAPSGWTGASYGATRSAAPFALLDTVYDAMQLVLDAEAGVTFPPLVVHWSPDNRPTQDERDIPAGDIGSSFYQPAELPDGDIVSEIYILGDADTDTDEYDRHVVAHEWGHYFENELSRSDSIGGAHTFGDRLDMRVAFGEGFGNAFSAMVTGSSVYSDAGGNMQRHGFRFDVEGRPDGNPAPGWFSEQSVHEILWDLFDDEVDENGRDSLALGFGPIYTVLRGPQRTTPALTSVFSFLAELKDDRPEDAAVIETLTDLNAIEPVQDIYGTGEDNDAGTENDNILPVYRNDLVVDGPPAGNVCSTIEFASSQMRTGGRNKLGIYRYLRFDVPESGRHRITVTTTEKPDDADFADPDFRVYRNGFYRRSRGQWSAECEEPDSEPGTCIEAGNFDLSAGEHVLEVYEWTNTNALDDEQYPPIGRTCFDVEVTRQ